MHVLRGCSLAWLASLSRLPASTFTFLFCFAVRLQAWMCNSTVQGGSALVESKPSKLTIARAIMFNGRHIITPIRSSPTNRLCTFAHSSISAPSTTAQAGFSFRQKIDIFILSHHFDSSPCRKRPRQFGMFSTLLANRSTCLLAPEHSLLLEICNQRRQEARCNSIVKSRAEQGAGAACARSLETGSQTFDMVWTQFDMPSTSKTSRENPWAHVHSPASCQAHLAPS
jgi:hypothetical protein